jgi:hypothetical protein
MTAFPDNNERNKHLGRLCFFQNQDFGLCHESGSYYFVHRASEAKVITDELGRAIWESLPGTEEEVVERSGEKAGAKKGLIQDFLRVTLCAGIINRMAEGMEEKAEKEGEEKGQEEGEKEEEGNSRFAAGEKLISSAGEAEDRFTSVPGLVSVIIITFNSEEHIKGCLESILNQAYENLEVIVVDNASKDRTVEIAQSCLPKAKVFPLQKNRYFPGAVNFGIGRAQGKFFLILNDDVELDQRCVDRLVERMMLEEQAGAVVPMMKFYNLRGFINGIGNQIREKGWGSDNFIGCVDVGQFSGLTEVPSACFAAVLLRRKAVEEVGLLDAKYKSYYEDTDWSFRCWMQGWKIVPEVRALVYHKFGAHWRTSERKLKLVARNRLRLALKLFEGRTFLRFLRNYVREDVRNCLSLLRRKEFGSAAAYLKAYISLALGLPGIHLQRWKFFHRKQPHLRASDILKKNPEPFSCLNDENVPVLDSGLISNYYSRHITGAIHK